MGVSTSLVLYRILFAALGCFMVATLIYTTVTDGSPFRIELLTPWMIATWIDFYVNVTALSFWVAYKESSWVTSVIWITLLVCFGSAATCAYIVTKLSEISNQDPGQDPIDLLLIRRGQIVNMKNSYVKYEKLVFTLLGAFMVAVGTWIVVTYTVVTHGFPFRKEILTPFGLHTRRQHGLVDNLFDLPWKRYNMHVHCGPTVVIVKQRFSIPCSLELSKQDRSKCSYQVKEKKIQ